MTKREEPARSQRAGSTTDEIPATKRRLDVERTAEVARLLAERNGAPPQYNSPEWRALPDDDPRKLRAVYVAAAAWDAYWQPDEVARRLADELDWLDREIQRRVRESSWDVWAGMPDWRSLGESYATLQRLRGAA